jgi:hypothetical protein
MSTLPMPMGGISLECVRAWDAYTCLWYKPSVVGGSCPCIPMNGYLGVILGCGRKTYLTHEHHSHRGKMISYINQYKLYNIFVVSTWNPCI